MKKILCLGIFIAGALSGMSGARAAHELNGYRSDFFPLKRIELKQQPYPAQSVVVAPSHWTQGLSSNKTVWIGDPDGDYNVQSDVFFEPFAGTLKETRQNANRKVKELAITLRANPNSLTAAAVDPGAVIVTFDGEGGPGAPERKIRNLFIFRDTTDGVAVMSYHMVVRNAAWSRPETADITQLLRAQLVRARFETEADIRDTLPPPDPAWKLAFRDLKVVEPYNFIRMRLPRRWAAHPDPEMLMYFAPKEETGTMHIAYEVMANTAEGVKALGVEGVRSVKTLDRRFTEKGVKLHNRYWMVLDQRQDQFILVTVALTLDEDQDKDREYQELVNILDQEVRRMRIGVAPNLSSNPSRAKDQSGKPERK